MERLFTVQAGELQTLVKRIKKAASKDDGRPALRCANLHLKGNNLLGVAADGFVLATQRIEVQPAKPYQQDVEWGEFNVKMEHLERAIKGINSRAIIEVEKNETKMRVVSNCGVDVEVAIESVSFPDYHQLASGETKNLATIAFDPAKVRQLLAGLPEKLVTRIRFAGEQSPATVATADGFWGLIMPCVATAYNFDSPGCFDAPS